VNQIDFSTENGIVYYDIFLEIDPREGIFRSEQKVTVTGNLVEGDTLTILLGDELVIDEISLENESGTEFALLNWEKVDSYSIDYWWGTYELSKIEIQTKEIIPPHERLVVNLTYHLPEEEIQEGLADNMYNLFVSRKGSHAGGPESGAFPQVSGNLSAPFSITIKHPSTYQCAVPGERVFQKENSGYTTVTYLAEIPYDPSFSCAPYKILIEESGAIQMELYSPAHLDLSSEMVSTTSQILLMYQELFGQPPADSFRVVFPDLNSDQGGGESNGNIVFLADIKPFLQYDDDEEAREIFAHLIAHESYHLWNTWGLNWEGTLAEWWVEGGATFLASWSNEMLFGNDNGARYRFHLISDFIEQEAYLHENNLSSLDDTWFDDWSLVYDYGAMVWEQLRQKIGDDAMKAGLRDFYETHGNQDVDYYDFVKCLEKYTEEDVAAFLEQWTQHNARINLILHDVKIQEAGEVYEVEAILEIDSDRHYELFTALGYKTSKSDDWQLIDLHFEESGRYNIVFSSNEKPQEISFDPEFRVPQINLDDNYWAETTY
jgi:aminopeptidase N